MSRSRATEASTVKKPVSPGQQGKIPGLAVVVMAAGLGKRMRSKQVKVLHPVAGQAMVLYSIGLGLRVAGDRVAVVVGHQADLVRRVIDRATSGKNGGSPVAIVEQREQLGTGHAVLQSRPVFAVGERGAPSSYLILNGDTPLLQESDGARTPSCPQGGRRDRDHSDRCARKRKRIRAGRACALS